jgi:hypothetical protein
MANFRTLFRGVVASLFLFSIATAWPQARPYPGADEPAVYQRLLKTINAIPIIDNHGHPGYSDDADVDQQTAPPGASETLRESAENPELVAAAKALFNYPYSDLSAEHAKWLVQKKAELKKQLGQQYFDRVLDKLNIETALANRAAMADYLNPKRFRWVFFCDGFLFPFDGTQYAAQNPDIATFVPEMHRTLERYMEGAGITKLPDDFDGYLQLVNQLMEKQKQKGGIAIKFEIAYLRPLLFSDPPKEQAAELYARYHNGGSPTVSEYHLFQDYVFRYVITEAGQLHLPVHIHSSVGIGNYFNVTGGDPMNLENILRDPRYTNTTFVLLHGGYPFEKQAIWLGALKNVYLDSSFMELFAYPSDFKRILNNWISV